MNWIRYAGKAVLSYSLSIIGVFLSVVVSTYIFNGQITDIWKLAGMLSGVYIGGTANMAAIGIRWRKAGNFYPP